MKGNNYMKKEFIDKIISVILFLVIIGIFSVIIVFLMIALQEWGKEEDLAFAETTQTVADNSENEKTVEDDIEVPAIVESPLSSIEKTNTTTNNNYSNVQVDKYFYNQLEEESRIIYRAFESNKEQMKTGTYQIELGTSFSDILSRNQWTRRIRRILSICNRSLYI